MPSLSSINKVFPFDHLIIFDSVVARLNKIKYVRAVRADRRILGIESRVIGLIKTRGAANRTGRIAIRENIGFDIIGR